MKAIHVPNGIVHIGESKADCPYCTRHIEFEEVEIQMNKSKDGYIRKKCKGCKRFIGITSDIRGDIVAFELSQNKE